MAERARSASQKNLVGFVVGDVQYAIEIARVREIVNPLEVTPLPHTPGEVAGVADHRGEVVPVIELRRRFGLPDRAADRATKWILVTTRDHLVGLVVDRVSDVFGAVSEDIRATPEVGGNRQVRGISGVVSHGGKLTFVLDTTRFAEIVDELAARGAL
ncbi:MAG TPA: chemotaxis protein CheW [Minicystis sp.]|nr:chemotaxis protein CheW [Minicystis sp.]